MNLVNIISSHLGVRSGNYAKNGFILLLKNFKRESTSEPKYMLPPSWVPKREKNGFLLVLLNSRNKNPHLDVPLDLKSFKK